MCSFVWRRSLWVFVFLLMFGAECPSFCFFLFLSVSVSVVISIHAGSRNKQSRCSERVWPLLHPSANHYVVWKNNSSHKQLIHKLIDLIRNPISICVICDPSIWFESSSSSASFTVMFVVLVHIHTLSPYYGEVVTGSWSLQHVSLPLSLALSPSLSCSLSRCGREDRTASRYMPCASSQP